MFSLDGSAQTNMKGYQYWFDDDFGSAVTTDVGPTQQLDVTTSLATDALTDGVHRLNIRFYDENNTYSSLVSRFFYKYPVSAPDANEIVSYQYWLDDDLGNAVTRAITASQQLNLNEQFDFSGLTTGLHQLSIRFKDNRGKWSHALSQFIYLKPEALLVEAEMVAYQYWLDDDFDNAVTTSIAPAQQLNLIDDLTVQNASLGDHTLHIRFKDQAQQWSPVVSSVFTKNEVSTALKQNEELMTVAIHPNPVGEKLFLSNLPDGVCSQIEVISLNGQKVHVSSVTEKEVEIDFSEYAKGVYVLVITCDEETKIMKIVKD